MLEQGYFLTAELRVKDQERVQEAREALKKLCADTVREPGCSLFCLHECTGDPGRFILWERFDNEEAFKRHFTLSHTRSYIDRGLTDIVQYFQTDIV